MGPELTTDRHPPITSQTHYQLRHATYLMNMMDNSQGSGGKKLKSLREKKLFLH